MVDTGCRSSRGDRWGARRSGFSTQPPRGELSSDEHLVGVGAERATRTADPAGSAAEAGDRARHHHPVDLHEHVPLLHVRIGGRGRPSCTRARLPRRAASNAASTSADGRAAIQPASAPSSSSRCSMRPAKVPNRSSPPTPMRARTATGDRVGGRRHGDPHPVGAAVRPAGDGVRDAGPEPGLQLTAVRPRRSGARPCTGASTRAG